MINPRCIAVLGGDRRLYYLAKCLLQKGFEVTSWNIDGAQWEEGKFACAPDWREAVKNAATVLLPLPVSKDGVRLFAAKNEEHAPRLSAIAAELCPGQTLLGGKLPVQLCKMLREQNIPFFDYLDSPLLAVKNALPTAEGAISLVMQRLPVTLCNSSFSVVGYGRIGERLTKQLLGLGASVAVFARRRESLALAEMNGALPVLISSGGICISSLPKDCRALFNTVPDWVFSDEALKKFPKECLYVELASPPGGMDISIASKEGINIIPAPGLPGKYAPESAGNILCDTVLSLLEL